MCSQVHPKHVDTAGRWGNQPQQHMNGCRLSCPIRTKQTKDFPFFDVEGDIINGGKIVKPLGEISDLKDRLG